MSEMVGSSQDHTYSLCRICKFFPFLILAAVFCVSHNNRATPLSIGVVVLGSLGVGQYV